MTARPWVRIEPIKSGQIFNSIFRHPLFSLILIGILIRCALAPYTSWTYDVETWYRTAMSIMSGTGLYDRVYFIYPPVWGYLLGGLIKIFSLFVNPETFGYYVQGFGVVTSPLFNLAFKTPLFIIDTLVGFIIYKFVLEITSDSKKAKFGFFLWFFNPLVIMASAVHGTIDTIPTLFTLLTIILISKQNYFWGGSTLALGILSKIFPVFFIPFNIGFILSIHRHGQNYKDKLKKLTRSYSFFFIGVLISTIIVTFPFLLQGTWRHSLHVILSRNEVLYPGGISPWVLLIVFPQYEWIQNNLQSLVFYSIVVGFLLVSIIGALAFFFSYKSPRKWLFRGSIATILIVYLTTIIVNPQYLLWVMPFLIIGYIAFEHSYKYIFIILNITGIVYYFSTNGFWHLFYPLAIFTKTVNLDFIVHGTQMYLWTNGFLTKSLRDDIILLIGLIATTAMVLSMFPNGLPFTPRKKTMES